jgi:DNA polymerase eta
VRAELLARYPYLSQVPSDAPNGLDTVLPPPPPIVWENRGILIPINPPLENSGPTDDTRPDGELEIEGDDTPRSWHDVALSIAAELMDKIRAEVHIQLGYTMSAVRSLSTGCFDPTVLS